jgi:succinate dehydrogenase cytochrome b556 subunit
MLRPLSALQQRSLSSGNKPFSVISEEEARKPTLQVDPVKRSEAFKRPTSPHLTIYSVQLTSTLSIFHRVTGAGIGLCMGDSPVVLNDKMSHANTWIIGMYGGALAYALSPVTSVGLIEAALSLPAPLLVLGKAGIASAFVFHSLNGLRHLVSCFRVRGKVFNKSRCGTLELD